MSTRANILFKDNEKQVLIHKQSDGYPEGDFGVIQLLKDFFKWIDGNYLYAEFAASDFIFFCKINNLYRWNKKQEKNDKYGDTIEKLMNPQKYGHRQEIAEYAILDPNEKHGDCAFFYEVILDNDGVTINVKESAEGQTKERYII